MLREEGPALSNISIEPSNYFLFSYGLSISCNIYLSDFIETWALGFCLQSGVQNIRGLPEQWMSGSGQGVKTSGVGGGCFDTTPPALFSRGFYWPLPFS